MDNTPPATQYELPPPASFRRSEPFAPERHHTDVLVAVMFLAVAAAVGIALWWWNGISRVPSVDVAATANVAALADVTMAESANARDRIQVRPGALMVENAPLLEVLSTLEQYTTDRFVLKDPRLESIKIGGAVGTGPEGLFNTLSSLELIAPVRVTRRGKLLIVDYDESGPRRRS